MFTEVYIPSCFMHCFMHCNIQTKSGVVGKMQVPLVNHNVFSLPCGQCPHGIFFLAEWRWRSVQQCWDEALVCCEKKSCMCILSPWQQYRDRAAVWMTLLCCFYCLFSVWNLLFTMSEHQTEDPSSHTLWMLSLITIWTSYHGCSKTDKDHGGCACMTWTNANTQTGVPLSVVRTAGGTQRKECRSSH